MASIFRTYALPCLLLTVGALMLWFHPVGRLFKLSYYTTNIVVICAVWGMLLSLWQYALHRYRPNRLHLLSIGGLCVFLIFFLTQFPLSGVHFPYIRPTPAYLNAYTLVAWLLILWALLRFSAVTSFFLKAGDAWNKILHMRGVPWIPAAAFFGTSVILCYYFYDFHPHVGDSINHYVHAKLLAEGSLAGALPPVSSAFFHFGFMAVDGDRWYSQYPPGHLIMLAMGHVLHAPWIVNPLQGAASIVMLYWLARDTFSPRVAHLTALLAAITPLWLFMSSEFMNHGTSMMFATAFYLCFVRSVRCKSKGYGLLAGMALGMVFLARPLTAVGICIPFVVWGVYLLWRQLRTHAFIFTVMAGAFFCVAAFQLWFNLQTTGDPFLYGYIRVQGEGHYPGFYRPFPDNTMHTPLQALGLAGVQMQLMNSFLFDWSIPSMLFVGLFFLTVPRNRYSYLFIAVYFSLVSAYAFNRFNSRLFGPRLTYEVSGLIILLTAAGMLRLPALLRGLFSVRIPARQVYGMLLCLLVCLWGFSASSGALNKHFKEKMDGGFAHGDNAFYARMMHETQKPALVFVPHRKGAWYYSNVAFENPPRATSPAIFALDLQDEKLHRQLMDYYPDRYVYIVRPNGELEKLREPKISPSSTSQQAQ